MTKTSLNLPYLLLTGTIIVCIATVIAVMYPTYADIKTFQQKTTETNSQVITQRDYLKTIDQKITALNSQQAQEKKLSVILPTNGNVDQDTMRAISQISSATGVTIIHILNESEDLQSAIRANVAHGNSGDLPADVLPFGLNIQASGTYQQIRDFLGQLEKTIRLTDVTSIDLSKNEQQPDQLNANIVLQSYILNNVSK
jgi:Tfp pilus assembly protein PilO